MVSSYTPNKSLEKPANGDYVDTWNIPVNGDMDVIDQALGGTTFLNATGGSAILSVSQYRAMAFSISGAMSANVVYTIPAGVGGCWIIYNNTTDATGGPWSVTFASGGGGTTITVRRAFNTTIYSDGTNIRLADNSSTAGGSNTNIQYNNLNSFAGSNDFVYDYNNARVGLGTSSPATKLHVNAGRTTLSASNEPYGLQLNNGSALNGPFLGSAGADIFVVSSSSGVERMRLDAGGNLGIGGAPGYRLDVLQTNPTRGILAQLGNLASSGQTGSQLTFLQNAISYWTIGQPAGTNAFSVWAGRWSGGDGTEVARWDGNGFLGLGTTSPTSRIDVIGPASRTSFTGGSWLGARVRGATSTNDYSGIDFSTNSSGVPQARIASVMSGSGSYLQFGTSNNYGTGITNAAMTIDFNGRVGIGTTAPSQALQVAGYIYSTSGGFIFPDGSVQSSATFVRTVNAGQGIAVTSTTGDLTVYVPNGGISAAMLQGGVAVANIGYQPLNPAGGLVTGTMNFLCGGNTNDGGQAGTLVAYGAGGGSGACMSFHRPGAFAINMGLDGDNVFRIGGWSAGANRMQLDMGGNVTFAGNVTAYSDRALKKDFSHIHDALDIVKSINGYRYTRIDTEQKEVGLVAQEVEAMLPELVLQTGEYKSLAYDRMVAVLVEAVKTLSARIELLEQK